MPLSDLPGELILSIADQQDIGGTSALSRTSSLFYGWLNGCLHRRDLTRHLRSVGHCSILIIEKTNLDQPPTLDFIVEFFRTQPTVPRPTVPSPQPYSLKSAVHHPPCSSIVHDLSTVHGPPPSTIHRPPRPSILQPILHTRSTILHNPQSTASLYSPRPATVRHPSTVHESTTLHSPPSTSQPSQPYYCPS